MKLHELAGSGSTPSTPLELELATQQGRAFCVSSVAVAGARSYVAQGHWRSGPVQARLLIGRHAAERFRREREGARLLSARAWPGRACSRRVCRRGRAAGCCTRLAKMPKPGCPLAASGRRAADFGTAAGSPGRGACRVGDASRQGPVARTARPGSAAERCR